MTFPRDPDSSLEELLRNALQGEADSISPAGDGLARIQQRVAARRSQRFWLRPVAVVGAAAVAGGAGFTAYALTAHPDTNDSVSAKPSTPVPSTLVTTPTTSPTPTISAPTTAFPASAFYPFTSAAAEGSWEAQKGATAQPWITDPVAEAKDFIAKFVLADGVDTVTAKQVGSKTASVTLGRMLSDGGSQRPHDVTTVHLQRYGKAWLVLGATDAGGFLKVASPASGARITSPVTVSGPGFGADEAVQVDVRAIGATFLTASRGQAQFGSGVPTWSTTTTFSPPADPRGAVVVIEDSEADGGPGRIAVTGVRFATDTTGYPAYFYAVKDDRVTKFSARTGASVSYLTQPEPGGGASDPQVVGDRVYYLSGSGTCANALKSVPTTGGASTLVASPRVGYVISSYAVTSDQQKTALFETSCLGTDTPRGLLVSSDRGSSQSHTVNFDSFPPQVVGDPSWEPDSIHLDAIVQTGTAAHGARYDAFAAKDWGDSVTLCSSGGADGFPEAVETDSSGAQWFAKRTGDAIAVERCIGTTPRVMFTVTGNRQPADLDVAGSGGAALVTDTDGHVWRWTQGGSVVQLSPKTTFTQLSW
jgi:hypothetical protein